MILPPCKFFVTMERVCVGTGLDDMLRSVTRRRDEGECPSGTRKLKGDGRVKIHVVLWSRMTRVRFCNRRRVFPHGKKSEKLAVRMRKTVVSRRPVRGFPSGISGAFPLENVPDQLILFPVSRLDPSFPGDELQFVQLHDFSSFPGGRLPMLPLTSHAVRTPQALSLVTGPGRQQAKAVAVPFLPLDGPYQFPLGHFAGLDPPFTGNGSDFFHTHLMVSFQRNRCRTCRNRAGIHRDETRKAG